MAFRRVFGRKWPLTGKLISSNQQHSTRNVFLTGCVVSVGVGGCSFLAYKSFKYTDFVPKLYAKDKKEVETVKPAVKVTYREMRFRQFASVEHHGILYMTPQDFLESMTEETPRPRIGQHRLNPADVESMLRLTPTHSRGSTKLFRSLHNKGLISYTEYLFLLCVLTKPHSGFRIAFNMFDTDGNHIVDKKEFLVLEQVFSRQSESKEVINEVQDTTLLIHFFGQNGKDVLKYDDFCRFMENLQSEVIELEFLEFSKGMSTISEVDFARILLRYTKYDSTEIDQCLERVTERIPEEKGITFKDFKQFCQFLNNLDDFSIAMKLYTYADHPVSQEDFHRAVKICTGFMLGEHIVNTMFQIFDVDGDGHLSHQEFISIMKDRLHRGSRSHLMHTQGNWNTYRTCVKNEMKSF
ncbi:hypothetical protein LOTGIDRAFT_230996 [Lottia gigantea]|uniref:EF-hand domain-containing protein n=1 Tax=Lottia gigantea TaxID=225164 RepID=V4CDP9_LOTGI|nr:hypothetical protein LOTGIDRAFT_230996 [Lottia gigantea]ESP00065.1 hypothetical protein LOTGIDRAFT_230996 [Lottia gigantea]